MFIVYLSGGQEVAVEGADEMRLELDAPFIGTEDASIMLLGGGIVLAHFRAGAVIGFREAADHSYSQKPPA